VIFAGDFREENKGCPDTPLPPFMSFAPGHFGMTSSLDIKVPLGYVLRTEPHPRYYTDTTNTVPCCLPGHIQGEWWPKIFFVVFKNPMPGQTIIFRKDEPYGQLLIIPKKVSYDISAMTDVEATERNVLNDKLTKYAKRFVKNNWYDHKGHNFDDKYKILSSIFAKSGLQGVREFIEAACNQVESKKRFRGKLVMRKKNEGVQNQEKKS